MNLRLVKTSKTLLPFKGMFGMPLPEWDGREVSPKSPRQSDRGGGPPGSKGVNVLIASEDPFVTDFLRGLVAIHGYEAEVVTDFDEASMKVRPRVLYRSSLLMMRVSRWKILKVSSRSRRNLFKEGSQ